MTDLDLLREFVQTHSQTAFTDLVRRHADWVYAVAARRVHDKQLAEEVAQAVFIVLSRKAPQLLSGRHTNMKLSAWLYQVVQLTSKRALRDNARRKRLEQAAATTRSEVQQADASDWDELMPWIDSTLASLNSTDREAVLLRFYQRQSFADVGRTMGCSEEAARKRVGRAIERIRSLLRRQRHGALGQAAIAEGLWIAAAPKAVGKISAGASANSLASGVIATLAWKGGIATALATAAAVALTITTVAAIVQLNAPSNAATQSPVAPAQVDPIAQQSMADMFKTFSALKSASWEMEFHQPENPPHFWGTWRKATVAFKRPNMAVVHSSDVRGQFWAMSDGKELGWVKLVITKLPGSSRPTEVPDPKGTEYYRTPAPLGDDAIKLVTEYGDADTMDAFRWMFAGIDPIEFRSFTGCQLQSLSQGPAGQVGGVMTDSIIAAFKFTRNDDRVTLTFDIGHDDHFIRRITQVEQYADAKFAPYERVATYTNVRLNPDLPDSAFAIAPPQGLKPGPAYFGRAPNLLVGSAPPPLATVDIEGKPVSLADYRGKVVLILFNSPVSAITKPSKFAGLYGKYHDRGFEILSIVANDAADAGYNELQLAQLALDRAIPWRVAYDAGRRLFTEYGVTGNFGDWNMALVIGRDGKIVMINPANLQQLESSIVELQLRKALDAPTTAPSP